MTPTGFGVPPRQVKMFNLSIMPIWACWTSHFKTIRLNSLCDYNSHCFSGKAFYKILERASVNLCTLSQNTYLRGQALMLYKKARLILSPWIEVTDQVNPVLLYQTHLLNNKWGHVVYPMIISLFVNGFSLCFLWTWAVSHTSETLILDCDCAIVRYHS